MSHSIWLGLLAALTTSLATAQPVPADALILASALSKPDAARILPVFASLDRSLNDSADGLATLADTLPAGDDGVRELARRIAALRAKAIARRGPHAFGNDFVVAPIALPGGQVRQANFAIELDFAPARALIDLLAAREQDPARILARLRQDDVRQVFEALVQHRSQRMYGTPMSLELLAQNIALASIDTPLHRLYAEVNPDAFLNFARVRRNLAAYQGLLNELERAQANIVNHATASLQPYVPAEIQFKRRISFLFCAGADGWASGGVAGIDLEYFRENTTGLIDTLVHESFHVAQAAATNAAATVETDAALALWANALNSLYREGSASFISPPRRIDAQELEQQLLQGRQLMEELERAVFVNRDSKLGKDLLDKGIRGAGPFYWLGSAMARAIVDDGGAPALAAVLAGQAPAFVAAYLRALTHGKGQGVLPDTVLARLAAPRQAQ